jgi:hypothetical protein
MTVLLITSRVPDRLLSRETRFVEPDDFVGRFAKAPRETIAAKFNFVKSRIASDLCGCEESVDTFVVVDASLKSARRIGFSTGFSPPSGFRLLLHLLLYRRVQGRKTPNDYRPHGAVALLGAIRNILTCAFNKESLETPQPLNFPSKVDDVSDPQPFDHVLGLNAFCDLLEKLSIQVRILRTQDGGRVKQLFYFYWNGRSRVDHGQVFVDTHISTNSNDRVSLLFADLKFAALTPKRMLVRRTSRLAPSAIV